MTDFGARLKDLRKTRGLTQKQLAELIGVRNSIISFYETGERTPSPEVIKRLAATLYVSTDYLLGLEHGETIDVSGLTEEDKKLVRILVETLRRKNQ